MYYLFIQRGTDARGKTAVAKKSRLSVAAFDLSLCQGIKLRCRYAGANRLTQHLQGLPHNLASLPHHIYLLC